VLDVYGGLGGLTLTANNQLDLNYNALCANDYSLEVVDANGCIDTASFVISEPDPVGVVLNIADVTCTGMNDGAVSIVPVGGTGPVVWSMVEQGLDFANMYEGEYHIDIQDSIGCSADTFFVVGAEEVTDMLLFMLSSPVTCWNEQDGTATVSVTGGYQPLSFVWSDASGQTTPTATGLPEDMYSVVVTDSLGCTLTETVEVEPTVGCLFIADAVTPNGDGYNDEWIVGGLEYFPNAVVTVFNRYGQEMFRSVGYRQRWDGRFNNNTLPVADYYYVIDFVDGTDPITGTVTLKY
jgi:gliding motility-associated-like protein